MKYWVIIAVGLLGPSCTLGPDYQRPKAAVELVERDFVENPKSISLNPPARETAWWEDIREPNFSIYVGLLTTENLTLREGELRLIQALERLRITAAERSPSITTSHAGSRNFDSVSSAGGGSDRIYQTQFNSSVDLSWQLDLFGKVRRSVQSAEASLLASRAEQDALYQSLIAQLANRYVAIGVNGRLLDLANETAKNRKAQLDSTRRRYETGARGTVLADVYLAEENYTSVVSEISEFRRLLTEELYQLDVLLGRRPGTTDVLEAKKFELLARLPRIPDRIPVALLDRRPDLRAAEFRTIAATADVGVAMADLYPDVSLTAGLGASGNELGDLLDSSALNGSLATRLVQSIFDGGRLRANIRLQEAELQELATRYLSEVLEAIREVETAIQADRRLTDQLAQQKESVDSLLLAEQASEARYNRGLLSLRDLLQTQQSRYRAEQSWLRTHQLRWNTRIALYLALGGKVAGGSYLSTP